MASIRRGLTWVLCLAAMAVGSLAWTAFVYLNTWADPAMTTRVTRAVLDDPEAADEVLAPVRGQVRAVLPAELGVQDAQVDAALDAVLRDPSARDRIADAFVSPDGDLRVSAASDAFRAELARQQPALAPYLEQASTPLSLPDLATATSARTAADTWVWRLAALSGLLFAASFVLGDARRTARRFGYWAVATGVLWVIGSPLATWLAPKVSSGFDATATVVAREYTRPIGPWALGLVIAGLVAVAGSFLVPRTSREPRAATAPPDARRTTVVPATPAPRRRAHREQGPTQPIPTTPRRVSTTRTMPVQRDEPTTRHDPVPTSRPDTDSDVESDAETDVDVWAAYDAPAPRGD